MVNVRAQGCVLESSRIADSELVDTDLRGTRFRDAEITASKIKDCRFDAIAFDSLSVRSSTLRKVSFRDTTTRCTAIFAPRRKSFRSSTATWMRSTFRMYDPQYHDSGIKAHGLRIRGADLTGMTITRTEDLEAFGRR